MMVMMKRQRWQQRELSSALMPYLTMPAAALGFLIDLSLAATALGCVAHRLLFTFEKLL
jgi:hypothetical protein